MWYTVVVVVGGGGDCRVVVVAAAVLLVLLLLLKLLLRLQNCRSWSCFCCSCSMAFRLIIGPQKLGVPQ